MADNDTCGEDSSRDGAATWVQFSGDVNPKLDMARDRELRLVGVMFSVKLGLGLKGCLNGFDVKL